MTSSFRIKKRFEEGSKWSFGDISDHYLSTWGVCHPNYTAIPIGSMDSEIKMCVKRKNPDGTSIDQSKHTEPENGFFRFSSDLYNPTRERPRQISNPSDFYKRVPPHQFQLTRDDYMQTPIKYNATGIQKTRSPGAQKYYQYTYDAMLSPKYEPPKYDVTRLQQPYPIWKSAQEYHNIRPNPNNNDNLITPI